MQSSLVFSNVRTDPILVVSVIPVLLNCYFGLFGSVGNGNRIRRIRIDGRNCGFISGLVTVGYDRIQPPGGLIDLFHRIGNAHRQICDDCFVLSAGFRRISHGNFNRFIFSDGRHGSVHYGVKREHLILAGECDIE